MVPNIWFKAMLPTVSACKQAVAMPQDKWRNLNMEAGTSRGDRRAGRIPEASTLALSRNLLGRIQSMVGTAAAHATYDSSGTAAQKGLTLLSCPSCSPLPDGVHTCMAKQAAGTQGRREGDRHKRKRKPERASEGIYPSSNGLHALHAAASRPASGMTTRRHARVHTREDSPDDGEAQPSLSCACGLSAATSILALAAHDGIVHGYCGLWLACLFMAVPAHLSFALCHGCMLVPSQNIS